MDIKFINKHNLTVAEIGMLWVVQLEQWEPEKWDQHHERYDLDGLKALMSLAEKGLIHYNIADKKLYPTIEEQSEETDKYKAAFDAIRKRYPQTSGKRGLEAEWGNWQKTCKKHKINPRTEISVLGAAIDAEIAKREEDARAGKKSAEWEWPMFQTYINQLRWTGVDTTQQVIEVKPKSPEYQAYYDWYKKRYANTPLAKNRELTEDQYMELKTFSGKYSEFRDKFSAERIKGIITRCHDDYTVNTKPGQFLAEFIYEALKKSS